jgi:hypothetical protein
MADGYIESWQVFPGLSHAEGRHAVEATDSIEAGLRVVFEKRCINAQGHAACAPVTAATSSRRSAPERSPVRLRVERCLKALRV